MPPHPLPGAVPQRRGPACQGADGVGAVGRSEEYTRGYSDGHRAGEQLGEQALRDRLLSQLAMVGCDLRLQLRHDMGTPIEVLHAIELLVQDRKTL